MKNRTLGLIVAAMLLMTLLLGACGGGAGTSPTPTPTESNETSATPTPEVTPEQTPDQAVNVTFSIPVWSPDEYDRLAELDLPGKVAAAIPGLTVEVELLKDAEFENDMKIRKNAGQLPDVFPLQGKWMTVFKEDLTPIDDLTAVQNHIVPDQITIDGAVLGIPQSQFNEFVYYRKSIFAEYGLSVPTTWADFIAACQTIKDGKTYIPLLIGAKDEWPDYPYNEFMPSIVAKDGDYWSKMADMDEPFAKGQPFYTAYEMIQRLYDAKVMGDDPLGIGWDQTVDMFVAKQGAIIAGGSWLLDTLKTKGIDLNDVGAFILPVRETASEPLVTTSMLETYWCINNKTQHLDTAKQFIEFWFSDAWYPAYINKAGLFPTIKGVKLENAAPQFDEALSTEGLQFISYRDGSEAFMNLRNTTQFDVKKIGVAMIQKSDLDTIIADLNSKWKAARAG